MVKYSQVGTVKEVMETIGIFAQHEYEQMRDGIIPLGLGYEHIDEISMAEDIYDQDKADFLSGINNENE